MAGGLLRQIAPVTAATRESAGIDAAIAGIGGGGNIGSAGLLSTPSIMEMVQGINTLRGNIQNFPSMLGNRIGNELFPQPSSPPMMTPGGGGMGIGRTPMGVGNRAQFK